MERTYHIYNIIVIIIGLICHFIILREDVTPHVAMINSQDAQAVKHVVETSVWQLINGQDLLVIFKLLYFFTFNMTFNVIKSSELLKKYLFFFFNYVFLNFV